MSSELKSGNGSCNYLGKVRYEGSKGESLLRSSNENCKKVVNETQLQNIKSEMCQWVWELCKFFKTFKILAGILNFFSKKRTFVGGLK